MSVPPDDLEGAGASTVASRMSTYLRGGGIIAPFITLMFAFLVGGLVVLITGHDPIATYKAIFEGTGLNYFLPGSDKDIAALNLQQTLIQTTPLILTGLAVAFAFRCGLFNIGGQGQYIIGSILALWAGVSFEGMPQVLHVLVCILVGMIGGAAWAAIAGALKAFVGTNEVISTIMLNWIAVWIGVWVFNLGSPLQTNNPSQKDVPVSADIFDGAKLPVFWGDPDLQGLHVGIFIALAGLLVFWVLLNRTTTGYEVRAVGFSPDAAAASGINGGAQLHPGDGRLRRVRRAGGDGRPARLRFRIATNDIPAQPGRVLRDRGRAARSQHGDRRGAQRAAVRRADHRHVRAQPRSDGLRARAGHEPHVHDPGDGRPVRLHRRARRVPDAIAPPKKTNGGGGMSDREDPGWTGIVFGFLAFFIAVPPITVRSWAWSLILALLAVDGRLLRRSAWARSGSAGARSSPASSASRAATRPRGPAAANLDKVVVWGALGAATLRYATPLIFGALGGLFSERSGVINIALEGMMLMGAFFGAWGADKTDSWVLGLVIAVLAGAVFGAVARAVRDHLPRRPDRLGHGAEPARGRHHGLPVRRPSTATRARPTTCPQVPDVHLPIKSIPLIGDIFGQLNLLVWLALAMVLVTWVVVFRTPTRPAAALGGREPAGGRDGRPEGRPHALRRRHDLGLAGRARRCVPVDRLHPLVLAEHDRRGAGSSRWRR